MNDAPFMVRQDQENQTMPGMGEFDWPEDLPDDHPFQEFFKRFGRPDRQDETPSGPWNHPESMDSWQGCRATSLT